MAGADCAPNSVEYWDDFYDDRRSAYDTLYGYEDLRTLLLSLMPLDSRRGQSKVLHAGCGTSNVTDGLWRDGFRSILNIDFSDVVVKLMADRWSDRAALSTEGDAMLTGVQWQQMDLTDLSQYPGWHLLTSTWYWKSLRALAFDAILCQAKDDMLDPRGAAALRELHRVLKLDGVLVSVAWGAERRKALLRSGGLFDVEVHLLPGQASQRPYVYFCRKRLPLPGSSVASQSCEIRGCKGNTPHQRAQEAKEPQVQIRTDGSLEVVIQLDGHAATDLTLDLSESELRWSLKGLTRSLPLPFAIDASSATARRFKNKAQHSKICICAHRADEKSKPSCVLANFRPQRYFRISGTAIGRSSVALHCGETHGSGIAASPVFRM
ncbi:Methyltransferase-like protein 13 [Symbiodinium microadriaticum]|uniref:Methyltransferase-like protein 13 n=1 Tax=Symbiodinium microadriaticum TaxID=2951 RepID=A0A1Q9EFL3_SYMMI|nr:Methyltransferase-like protein 13 [Symbiodinium microadriaticum]